MAGRFVRTVVTIATCNLLALATPAQPASQKPLPSFEAATIKPAGTLHRSGFQSYPGGRVQFEGIAVKELMSYAFDIQEFQISGGPTWTGDDRYDLSAVPPDSSASRTAIQPPILRTPSPEQQEMLQSLLLERFGLHFHWETKDSPVYILSRGKKPLALEEQKDKEHSGCAVFLRGDIADGEVRCANASMDQLARVLGQNLDLPVINRTGIDGRYDLHVLPFDPSNHEIITAMVGAMDRLGLKLERNRGPVKTLVIDSVTRPTAN